MESHRLEIRKIAWAAASLLGAVVYLTFALFSPQAVAARNRLTDCVIAPPINTCHVQIPPIGTALPPASTAPAPGGTTQPPLPPRPTATPPFGLVGGYYTTVCTHSDTCTSGYASKLYYVSPTGDLYQIDQRCVASCIAPTPRPQPTQGPPTEVPCNTNPGIGGGNIGQPCTSQWPGYDLSVSVRIPDARVAVNPWPRSLNGLRTLITFEGVDNRVERFSNAKALPCAVDRAEHDGDFNCGSPVGTAGEGTQANYQLGVAWQRWTIAGGPFMGYRPPYEAAMTIEDREWNGGNVILPVMPGQQVQHTFETSSFGLDEIGPAWNPACQNRDCNYSERVLPNVHYPAYHLGLSTWWWPEWTWKYDQYVCVHKEPEDCFYDPNPGGHGCSHGPNAHQPGWKETITCVAWQWKNFTEPWRQYDIRPLGFPHPLVPWGGAVMAGMDPDGHVQTGYNWTPAIPVIEIQPVGVP